MESYDLFVFGGQSNMAGRGEAEKAPLIEENIGFEFRAISDPTKLHKIVEPFGAAENNPEGINEPNMKKGSLVSSFVETYHKLSGRKIIGVSASKGGSHIAQWQRGEPFLVDLLYRLEKTKYWLTKNNIHMNHFYLLWLQGESDGDLRTPPEEYARMTRLTFDEIKRHDIEHFFMIQIGNYRNDQALYHPIQEAQRKLALDFADITIVSTCLKKMAERGLMKDEFHYYQDAYNECGKEAAQYTIDYLKKGPML